MYELKVTRFVTKKQKECIALYVDLKYTRKFLSFNVAEIAEILNMTPADFYNHLALDEVLIVGIVDGIPRNKNE